MAGRSYVENLAELARKWLTWRQRDQAMSNSDGIHPAWKGQWFNASVKVQPAFIELV